MFRQVGLAIGVAVLVAVLGTPGPPAETLHVFQASWLTIGGFSLLAAVAAAVLLVPRREGAAEVAVAGSWCEVSSRRRTHRC
jgi:hypothetical protein